MTMEVRGKRVKVLGVVFERTPRGKAETFIAVDRLDDDTGGAMRQRSWQSGGKDVVCSSSKASAKSARMA